MAQHGHQKGCRGKAAGPASWATRVAAAPTGTGVAGSQGLGPRGRAWLVGSRHGEVAGPTAPGLSRAGSGRGGPVAAAGGLGGRKGTGDVIAAWNLLFGGVAMETGRLRVGKNSKPKRV